MILGQCQVADKRGEAPAARTLLSRLEVAGMALTLDALHTTKATARLITQRLLAHHILILKGNQPLARAAASALLTGLDTDWINTTASDNDHGHGRTERRTAPADESLFPGARQTFRLRRDAGDLDGAWTARKSCTASPACRPTRPDQPPQLNHIERAHWGVETVSIGSATLHTGKITPRSGPAPSPGLWPGSETW